VDKLGNLSCIRGLYRALLKSGRTYAAFEEDKVFPLVQKLAERREILDPMAGYGTLMSYCSKRGVSAYSIEYNPPAYLWQVLIHPGNAMKFITLAQRLKEYRKNWPQAKVKASVSKDWFPDESKRILLRLFYLCKKILNEMDLSICNTEELCLAFLLPFVGRFSSSVTGNIVIHIKRGGICVYTGWQTDFYDYINAVVERLLSISDPSVCKVFRHQVIYGDCRTIELPESKFAAMITSPPFPNSQDYSSMFAPENAFLVELTNMQLIGGYPFTRTLIGTVYVSSIKAHNEGKGYTISSTSAKKFLSSIDNFKGKTKDACYDNKVYYIPYFASYFSELEKAFLNISKALSNNFEGYIIVVNNTTRNIVVPISDAVVEIWRNLGFDAEIDRDLTREMSHLGSINPRAKGLRARHMEYTIKVWRK